MSHRDRVCKGGSFEETAMRDKIHGKPGLVNRPSRAEEAPVPLGKPGKGKMPGEKIRKQETARSEPGVMSKSPRPTRPLPAAQAGGGESEALVDAAELSRQMAEIAR